MRKVHQFAILGILGIVITMLAMGLIVPATAAVVDSSQPTGEISVDLLTQESQIFADASGFECHALPSFGIGMEYCTVGNLTETSSHIEIIRENHTGAFQYTTLHFDRASDYYPNLTQSVARIGIIRAKESGIIQHVTLMQEANQVTLGDLIAVLGQPVIQQFDHQTYFTWANSGVSALAFSSTVEISNSLPIWRIFFVPRTSDAPA